MKAAKQFLTQLQEGNTTEAIKTIRESLHERSVGLIEEQRSQVLESYGFSEKKHMKEEDEEKDDKEEKDDDSDSDKDEEKDDDEDKKEDE